MNKILTEDTTNFASTFPLWQNLKGANIAVTGATGLLGSCMVRCLLALNKEYSLNLRVTIVVRNRDKAIEMFGDDAPTHYIYVHDFANHDTPLNLQNVDYLIHFAAPTASKYFINSPVETINTVVDGTNSVLEFAKNTQLKSLVFASTLEVYGTVTDDSQPLTEENQGYINPLDARSSYPMAKRMAECLCHAYVKEHGVNVKIARLAQTFGAGVTKEDNRVFAQFAHSIINNQDIILQTTGELSRSYCYTTDAVSALLHILLKGENGKAYNVANEQTYISIIDMAKMLCREFNPKCEVKTHLGDNKAYSPDTKLRLSTAEIQRLGWIPQYDLREMFSRLISSLSGE